MTKQPESGAVGSNDLVPPASDGRDVPPEGRPPHSDDRSLLDQLEEALNALDMVMFGYADRPQQDHQATLCANAVRRWIPIVRRMIQRERAKQAESEPEG